MGEVGKPTKRVILDTNILVAAGFNPKSYSARIVRLIRLGNLIMVWNRSTLSETKRIINQIPRLRWEQFKSLYLPEEEIGVSPTVDDVKIIDDPDDRKFAALAVQTKAYLITNDDHLLSVKDQLSIEVLTPEEMIKMIEDNDV